MITRRIENKDILLFEEIGQTNSPHPKLNLQQWIDGGRTQLAFCFVLEEEGDMVGRLIAGVFEEAPSDIKIWQIRVIGSDDEKATRTEKLLLDTIDLLQQAGHASLEYHLYASTVDLKDQLIHPFMGAGFNLMQSKQTFELSIVDSHLPALSKNLTFKSLSEVGQDAFKQAIQAVTEETLDQEDLRSVLEIGPEAAAAQYFEMLQELDDQPDWWQLAYDGQDQLVGLVVPQDFGNGRGIINYIGVTPAARGKGFGTLLIQKAVQLLADNDMEKVVADVDVLNQPLVNQLTQAGFTSIRQQSVLHKSFK